MIREYGREVEADLACLPAAVDLRDLWVRGSGLTFRRLGVLLMGLPADGWFKTAYRAAQEQAQIPEPDHIRSAQRAFEERNARARAAEEAG